MTCPILEPVVAALLTVSVVFREENWRTVVPPDVDENDGAGSVRPIQAMVSPALPPADNLSC